MTTLIKRLAALRVHAYASAQGKEEAYDKIIAEIDKEPAQSVSIPAGWKLVPDTLTDEMRDALYQHIGSDCSGSSQGADEGWGAALEVAPAPPSAPAAAVPAGYKLAPLIPDTQMCAAGFRAAMSGSGTMEAIYCAMMQVIPAPVSAPIEQPAKQFVEGHERVVKIGVTGVQFGNCWKWVSPSPKYQRVPVNYRTVGCRAHCNGLLG